MGLLEAFKKSRITCPHCQAGFDLGPDFQAITTSATKLFDSLASFLDGSEADDKNSSAPFADACAAICENFDVAPSRALELLETALDDDLVLDTIMDFLDEPE